MLRHNHCSPFAFTGGWTGTRRTWREGRLRMMTLVCEGCGEPIEDAGSHIDFNGQTGTKAALMSAVGRRTAAGLRTTAGKMPAGAAAIVSRKSRVGLRAPGDVDGEPTVTEASRRRAVCLVTLPSPTSRSTHSSLGIVRTPWRPVSFLARPPPGVGHLAQ